MVRHLAHVTSVVRFRTGRFAAGTQRCRLGKSGFGRAASDSWVVWLPDPV